MTFTLFFMSLCAMALRLITKNRRMVIAESINQQSLSELRQLSKHILTVRERERKRIAQDIHDDLGQNLLVLKMDATAMGADLEGVHTTLDQRASLMLNNINATIKSMKSIMNDLRPPILELGLLAGIEWQLNQFMRSSGIDCTLVAIEGAELGLDEEKVAAVFRIFQEALSNVVRHA
jgi:signal transduction histidine kinase